MLQATDVSRNIRKRAHHTRRRDLPDVVPIVRDVPVATLVRSNELWIQELGGGALTVRIGTDHIPTRHSADQAFRRDLAQRMVATLGHHQVAYRIHSKAVDGIEGGRVTWPIQIPKTADIARQQGDFSRGGWRAVGTTVGTTACLQDKGRSKGQETPRKPCCSVKYRHGLSNRWYGQRRLIS